MNKIGGMCLNWKVIAGLAAVGLGAWVVAPNLVGAALPLLILAACPLSMLVLMRGMRGGQCASQAVQASPPARTGLTREEQLAELKADLAGARAQQEAVAGEIARLEAAERTPGREAEGAPAVHEAEAVARAADERVQRRA